MKSNLDKNQAARKIQAAWKAHAAEKGFFTGSSTYQPRAFKALLEESNYLLKQQCLSIHRSCHELIPPVQARVEAILKRVKSLHQNGKVRALELLPIVELLDARLNGRIDAYSFHQAAVNLPGREAIHFRKLGEMMVQLGLICFCVSLMILHLSDNQMIKPTLAAIALTMCGLYMVGSSEQKGLSREMTNFNLEYTLNKSKSP